MDKKFTAAGLAIVMGVSIYGSSAIAMEGMEAEVTAETTLETPVATLYTEAELTMEKPMREHPLKKPEGWENFTREEKAAFMVEHKMELKMAIMERRGERREDGHDHLMMVLEKMEIEVPENWAEMTRDEKKAFLESNDIDFDRESMKDMVKNNRNSKKADRFKNLEKKIEALKDFMDKKDISREEAVAYLQARGVVQGYVDGSFKPKSGISRAEAVKIVLEAIGEGPAEVEVSTFSDVEAGAWYKGYIHKAKAAGYIEGYADGTFKPNQTVNKVELMKIAFKIMGVDVSEYVADQLPLDADETAWYGAYLQYAVDTGLIDLDGEGNVKPGEDMTREEFSEFVYRLILQQEAL